LSLVLLRYDTGLMLKFEVEAADSETDGVAIYRAQVFVEKNPQVAEGWHKLGLLTANTGDYGMAIRHYERAIVLEPQNPTFHLNMGNAYAQGGDNLRAIECYGKTLQLDPNSGVAWNNLGNLFLRLKDVTGAIECYQRALRFQPAEGSFRYNLGRTLDMIGRHAEGFEHLLRASELNPYHCDTWTNLGNACQHLGGYEQALSCYDRALELTADPAELHVNRAVVLLNQGNFREGWKEYEYRWETATFRPYKKRPLGKPQWKGEPLVGKRILLHAEQGFGDAIQFARFIPVVKSLGAEVFLEVGAPLQSLLECLLPSEHILIRGESLPDFDYHSSLMSLPFALGLEIDSIPSESYLTVPAPARKEGRAAIAKETLDSTKLRVGLCWRGNPTHRWDNLRSLKPAQLAPLSSLSGIQWFLLQRDITAEELASFPVGLCLTTLPDQHLDGFLPIAALVQELDLVISVDTATAHLTGALGKPLWLLIPAFYEWRWHAPRTDSPWYPSARLFRQSEPGSWQPVIEQLARALEELVR
jgi:tetratricopeptide (TPR) repeat protein